MRYSEKCGYCPQLNARHECDLSRWGWLRKAAIWPKLKVTFITPSHWLAGRAASSSLLRSERIDVIPNGVDTSRFTPCDRVSARAVLSVSDNETVLLYGATSFTKDTNKGFYLLLNALKQVIARFPEKKLVLALFGDSNYNESEFLGIPIRSYGQVSSEEQLVNLYGSADFFVLPSLQENLPNTVMEAMACGTPCVAFDVGGVGDLICHGENGYVVKEDSANALAGGIEWMLTNPDERKLMGRQARQTITANFALASIADSYLKLYDKVATGD